MITSGLLRARVRRPFHDHRVSSRFRAHSQEPVRLRLEESEQIRVDLVLLGRAQAVRRVFVHLQLRVVDQLGGQQGRRADGHDLVVVAM
jgi:hypothetical protein